MENFFALFIVVLGILILCFLFIIFPDDFHPYVYQEISFRGKKYRLIIGSDGRVKNLFEITSEGQIEVIDVSEKCDILAMQKFLF